MRSISPEKLQQRIAARNSVRLLDVRTPAEFASGHIPHAELEPLEHLDAVAFATRQADNKEDLYVICQSGSRARKAIKNLEAAGLCNCVLVEGGMAAWVTSGFDVERQATRMISLERQVRIAAGLLVLCGTVLGMFVHPALLVLPTLIGAGLVFAGISDICGMSMVLARMPWNQINCHSKELSVAR